MAKKRLIVIGAVIAGFFMLGIIKDQVIKSVVTVVTSNVTGAPVHIDSFSLGIFTQSVKISGFKIYNPKGFSRGILVDLTKIKVTCDLGALFRKKLHLVNVEVELRELGLEKNKEGVLNVDSLKVVKEGKKESAKKGGQMPMQIDRLKLSMGKIVLKDYSTGSGVVVSVYDIGINQEYKNITSAQQLIGLILAEPMKAAGIRSAKIYGAAMLAGVAVLPVAAAFTLAGQDSATKDIARSFDRVFDTSLAIFKQKGEVSRQDRAAGVVSGNINSADITVKIIRKSGNQAQVTVSARKYLLPKPEIAGGILYEISEKLK
ncbi:MAG: hypothetical protein PHI59_07120 [Candidatus Omnitrophica bacterium]|nr:hypothetical protein [Candidatus Omnitrophota bacterium]